MSSTCICHQHEWVFEISYAINTITEYYEFHADFFLKGLTFENDLN